MSKDRKIGPRTCGNFRFRRESFHQLILSYIGFPHLVNLLKHSNVNRCLLLKDLWKDRAIITFWEKTKDITFHFWSKSVWITPNVVPIFRFRISLANLATSTSFYNSIGWHQLGPSFILLPLGFVLLSAGVFLKTEKNSIKYSKT